VRLCNGIRTSTVHPSASRTVEASHTASQLEFSLIGADLDQAPSDSTPSISMSPAATPALASSRTFADIAGGSTDHAARAAGTNAVRASGERTGLHAHQPPEGSSPSSGN
jgi:hypothetical protein